MASATKKGVAAGFKTIESVVAEMQFTIALIPELSAIYFCPDFDGDLIYKVSSKNHHEAWERHQFLDPTTNKPFYQPFRKPASGMITKAINDLNLTDASDTWMIGDRSEDENCAKNAGINFMWADIFRQRFLPGMYEVKNATKEQVEFLENIKL